MLGTSAPLQITKCIFTFYYFSSPTTTRPHLESFPTSPQTWLAFPQASTILLLPAVSSWRPTRIVLMLYHLLLFNFNPSPISKGLRLTRKNLHYYYTVTFLTLFHRCWALMKYASMRLWRAVSLYLAGFCTNQKQINYLCLLSFFRDNFYDICSSVF